MVDRIIVRLTPSFLIGKWFLIGICMLLLTSCSKKASGLIDGIWSIDEIYYQDQDYRFHIRGNMLSFERSKCYLPILYPLMEKQPLPIKRIDDGLWHTTEENGCYYLHIETTNKLFNGRHKIVFWKDEKEKMVKMTISSKDLYLVCRKGLFNFDLEAREWEEFFHEENCVEQVGV